MIHVRTGGVWRAATAFVRHGGVWMRAAQVSARSGGAWHETGVLPLAAVASPTTLSASRVGPGEVSIGSVTCTVTGGVAPYAYNWQRTGGYAGIGATASTSATTPVVGGAGEVGTYSAQFKCTVTDARGQSVESNGVGASFTINLS